MSEQLDRIRQKVRETSAAVRPVPAPKVPDPRAVERVEIRRLQRELFPPPPVEAPLSQAEQLEALRAAVAAKRAGDPRGSAELLAEAAATTKAKRPPPPRRG